MVYWINRLIGTMSASEDLKEGEYNSIILDCRLLADGYNEPVPVMNFIKNAMAHYEIASQRKERLVLRCEAGISRSNAVAVALLVGHCSFEFEEAVKYVKKKVKRAQIDSTLLNCIRSLFGAKHVGEFNRPEPKVNG